MPQSTWQIYIDNESCLQVLAGLFFSIVNVGVIFIFLHFTLNPDFLYFYIKPGMWRIFMVHRMWWLCQVGWLFIYISSCEKLKVLFFSGQWQSTYACQCCMQLGRNKKQQMNLHGWMHWGLNFIYTKACKVWKKLFSLFTT